MSPSCLSRALPKKIMLTMLVRTLLDLHGTKVTATALNEKEQHIPMLHDVGIMPKVADLQFRKREFCGRIPSVLGLVS